MPVAIRFPNDVRTKEFVIGSGAAEIADGIVKGDITWDFAGKVVGWRLLADQAGDIKLDIWRCTYAQFDNATHPVDADSICNGHEPEIAASGHKAEDNDLSDWTDVDIADGDVWRLNVDSCTTITCATLRIKVLV